MILGDFNSNQKWDNEKRVDAWWNHASVIEELKEIGFKSLYHFQNQELHGLETQGTYFHHKKEKNSHHIDYIFCTYNLLFQSELKIGEYKDWIEISDHVPLQLNLEDIK